MNIHYNPETEWVRRCRTTSERCPLRKKHGDIVSHFDNAADAQSHSNVGLGVRSFQTLPRGTAIV